MTSGNMLRDLTCKLKTSSLNEVNTQENETDKDSGTESDDENNNLDEADLQYHKRAQTDRSYNARISEKSDVDEMIDQPNTHEISDHNFDTISCTSDYERQSLDFDGHSSEDELESITEETITEQYKCHLNGCHSTSSTDEEVKELLFNPQPVLLRSSPPTGILKIYTENEKTQHLLIRVVTPILKTMSPRKRHRQSTASDCQSDSDDEFVIQRPCLDFEKMQKVKRLGANYFKRCKMSKNVKLQTV